MFKEVIKAIWEAAALYLFARVQKKLGDNKPKPEYEPDALPWLGLPRGPHDTTPKWREGEQQGQDGFNDYQ